MYKTNDVAKLAGVSVRTLHHYDRISLLKPTSVEENGYRQYSEEDFVRLQQILFFKELDFSLQEIKAILDNPNFDRKKALQTHKELLMEKKNRLDKIIQSVDRTMESLEGGFEMSKKEMFEPFDMKKIEEHQKKYEKEVKERWGNTKAYEESSRKTAKYREEDWKRIQEKSDNIYRRAIVAMPNGPATVEAQAIVEEWRNHISENFYECTPEILRGLGEMYVNDARFTANIDKYKEGLAQFLSEAIGIYCNRLQQK